ncbi:hypothetical protein HD597_001016 [Nonomuraea thailandensis]|uniref:Uncharacterized protein n=1 Tax=Nonomuraea thailandensis TaxID=1188745 RepID=A0A9X2K1X3_9ACTN|nr:hypothetical protein [Nonomuraea thailandensis]
MNYIGVTTRCCGPTVEARDHERKLSGALPLKSLISPPSSSVPGVSSGDCDLPAGRSVTSVASSHGREQTSQRYPRPHPALAHPFPRPLSDASGSRQPTAGSTVASRLPTADCRATDRGPRAGRGSRRTSVSLRFAARRGRASARNAPRPSFGTQRATPSFGSRRTATELPYAAGHGRASALGRSQTDSASVGRRAAVEPGRTPAALPPATFIMATADDHATATCQDSKQASGTAHPQRTCRQAPMQPAPRVRRQGPATAPPQRAQFRRQGTARHRTQRQRGTTQHPGHSNASAAPRNAPARHSSGRPATMEWRDATPARHNAPARGGIPAQPTTTARNRQSVPRKRVSHIATLPTARRGRPRYPDRTTRRGPIWPDPN